MIKLRLLLILLLANVMLSRAQLTPKEIAKLKTDLVRAVDNEKLTDSMYTYLNKLPNKTPLIMAYYGSLEALKGKHAWNPYTKVKYIKTALKTLGKAVDLDKSNLEIRFMRFSIEHYVPGFLGLSKDLQADRQEILRHYRNHSFGNADQELIKNAARFLIDSKRCSAEEVKVLKKYI